MSGGDIHDRFKDVREEKTSAKDFFKALTSGAKASGMGHRVYRRADEGSSGRTEGAHIEQRENWRGQLGERPQVCVLVDDYHGFFGLR
jgi:hypothetical protein